MTQFCFKEIGSEWKSLEEIIGNGFSANNSYEIQNRGTWLILVLESDTKPAQDNFAGRVIREHEVYNTKIGQTIYLRTIYNECLINVAGDGEMTEYTPNLIRKTITQNGTYKPVDDNADGYSEVVVNVPSTATGKIQITNLNEVDVSQYASAVISDDNLVSENIKTGVEILGVMGSFEGSTTVCSHIITATNNSSYDRKANEKVWFKFLNNEYQIIDFTDADADTYTGTLLYDSDIGDHAEIRAIIDGDKVAHEFTYDFIDTGVPRPIINADDNTVTFNDISQVVLKIKENMPSPPTESVEIVVKMKSSGVGECDYTNSGCNFFEAASGQYLLAPFIRMWCGNGVRVGYDGATWGKPNSSYDVVTSEDFKQDKWYWVKVLYTAHSMEIYSSEDGAGWKDCFTLKFDDSVDVLSYFTSYRNHFILQPFRTGDTVDGVYDLKETHVKFDDNLVWQPISPVENSY